MNHTKYWTPEWRKNAAANISQADKNWLTVKATPEPGDALLPLATRFATRAAIRAIQNGIPQQSA